MQEFAALLGKACSGEPLASHEAEAALDAIMAGLRRPDEIALLLTALHERGETAAELAGAARSLRKCMRRIASPCDRLVDTCGTGGGSAGAFNISTAAAFVAAAAGARVAKHGNRRITSKSGSADVLAELGVNVQAELPTVERCLAEAGLCFCFAPLFHPAMKQVAEVRRSLPFPTLFNLLGPLCNPAGAPFQLLGTPRRDQAPLLAAALVELGTQGAYVVCGEDGLGEVSLSGPTLVWHASPQGIRTSTWTPEAFGVPRAPVEALGAADPQESAEIIRGVLQGRPGPPRDVVVLNAAAALIACGLETEPSAAALRAAQAIDSGAARTTWETLARISHGPTA